MPQSRAIGLQIAELILRVYREALTGLTAGNDDVGSAEIAALRVRRLPVQ